MKGKRFISLLQIQIIKKYSCSINMECFESLRRSDIYAIGLLYWEVCRRTIGSCKIAEEYKGECQVNVNQSCHI